jgi:hypothetical protein
MQQLNKPATKAAAQGCPIQSTMMFAVSLTIHPFFIQILRKRSKGKLPPRNKNVDYRKIQLMGFTSGITKFLGSRSQ